MAGARGKKRAPWRAHEARSERHGGREITRQEASAMAGALVSAARHAAVDASINEDRGPDGHRRNDTCASAGTE